MDNVSNNTTATDLEIARSTHLSLVEIIFGSIGHGFKVPFTGLFLSLYQLNVLANAINKDNLPRSSAVEISGVVSVLKSFSPAGQKLGPMVSILVQGVLFWFGTLLGGLGIIGQLLGGSLLAVWSFLQPMVTFFIIFGFDLLRMLAYYEDKMAKEYPYTKKYLLALVLGIVVIKIILAWAVVFYSYYQKKEWTINTQNFEKLVPAPQYSKDRSVFVRALNDLANPLFIVSFLLMILFFWQIETDKSQVIWLSLRPLATAYLIFYFIRNPWTHKFFKRLSQRSNLFNRFYERASQVIKLIEEKRELRNR